jgi:hypothetical protein
MACDKQHRDLSPVSSTPVYFSIFIVFLSSSVDLPGVQERDQHFIPWHALHSLGPLVLYFRL